jgi:hypothetical protein
MAIGLLMDVHVNAAITHQLRRRGVDVLTAQDHQSAQLPDEQLLERAAVLGRVIFTNDIRFHALAESWQQRGTSFNGLVFAHPNSLFHRAMEIIAKATDAPIGQTPSCACRSNANMPIASGVRLSNGTIKRTCPHRHPGDRTHGFHTR